MFRQTLRKAIASVSTTALLLSSVIVPGMGTHVAQAQTIPTWFVNFNSTAELLGLGTPDGTRCGAAGFIVETVDSVSPISEDEVKAAVAASPFDSTGNADCDVWSALLYHWEVSFGQGGTKDSPSSNFDGGKTLDKDEQITMAARLDARLTGDTIDLNPSTDTYTDDDNSFAEPYNEYLTAKGQLNGEGGQPGAPSKIAGSGLIPTPEVIMALFMKQTVSNADGTDNGKGVQTAGAADIAALGGSTGVSTGGGDLRVELNSASPGNKVAPQNAFEEVYTVFDLINDSSNDVTAKSIEILRTGFGAAGNFSSITLYNTNTGLQVGSEKTFSTSDNNATFTNLNLKIPSNGKVTLESRGTHPGGGINGAVNAHGVVEVITDGGSVSGLPVTGGEVTLANSLVSTMTLTETNITGSFEVGDRGERLYQVEYSNGTNDSKLISHMIEQTGSVDGDKCLDNFEYRTGGEVVATMDDMSWNGDYLTVLFKNDGYDLERGESPTFQLFADITCGVGETVSFKTDEPEDIISVDQTLESRSNVTVPTFSPTAKQIDGGVITFSEGADSRPDEQEAVGADDVELGQMEVYLGGDAVRVEQQVYRFDLSGMTISEVTDFRVIDMLTGDVVAGPIDPTSTTVTLPEDIEVYESTTWKLTADIANSVSASDTIEVNYLAQSGQYEYINDNEDLGTGDVSPNVDLAFATITIDNPTLTIALSATFQPETVVLNKDDQKVFDFTAQANTASSFLKISSATFSQTAGAGAAASGDFQSCELFRIKDGAVLSVTNQTKDLTTGTPPQVTFSSLDDELMTIDEGVTALFRVTCDVPSSATAGNTPALGVAATSDFTVEDDEGNTSTVTVTGTPNSAGNATDTVLTLVASGSLALRIDSDTASSYAIGTDMENVEGTTFEWEATNDSYEIERFQLKVPAANSDEVTSLTAEYEDRDGNTHTSTVAVNSNGEANFTLNPKAYIPQNEEKKMTAYINTAKEEDGADSGATYSVDFDFDTNFEAFGEGANDRLTTVGSADVLGEDHTQYASVLTVSKNPSSPTTSSVSEGSDQAVSKFDFDASGSESNPDILSLGVSFSGTAVLGRNTATGPATLIDDSNDIEATENYVQATSDGGSASTTTIKIAAAPAGIPIGANVIIRDDSAATDYVREVVSIDAAGNVVFTPAITGYDDAAADTLSYVPGQPGTGHLWFGAAAIVTANVNNADASVAVDSADGFSIGDTPTVRGTDANGVTVECTMAALTALTGTVLTGAVTCATNIDFDYDALKPPVASQDIIDEEISGKESLTVKIDTNGATPTTTGTRTIQGKILNATDIRYRDDELKPGEDVDTFNKNSKYVIKEANLNKKEGDPNFSINTNAIEFIN